LSSCHESPLVIIPYQYSKIKRRFQSSQSGDAPDSALPANRCSRHPKGHSDGVRIYWTYRPMNGQPMLPKWPNDRSSHKLARRGAATDLANAAKPDMISSRPRRVSTSRLTISSNICHLQNSCSQPRMFGPYANRSRGAQAPCRSIEPRPEPFRN
jgi:hypothetical protein